MLNPCHPTGWHAICYAYDMEHEYIAYRIQDEPAELGARLEPSRVWVDGDPTDELLDGTCGCTKRESLSIYHGRYLVTMGGDHRSWGEDKDEVILRDAVVLACELL